MGVGAAYRGLELRVRTAGPGLGLGRGRLRGFTPTPGVPGRLSSAVVFRACIFLSWALGMGN